MAIFRTNDEIIKKINNIGLKSNPPYICINPRAGRTSKGNFNLVILKCVSIGMTKRVRELLIKKGYNPFRHRGKDKTREKEINQIGKNSPHPFVCTIFRAGKSKNGDNLVQIKSLVTGEIKTSYEVNIKRGMNPFKISSDLIRIKEINKIGKKSNPKFSCVDFNAGKNSHGARLITVKCLKTGEQKTRTENLIKRGHNPFYFKSDDKEKKEIINKIGRKYDHPFICTNFRARTYRGSNVVELKSLETGQLKYATANRIINNLQNPFNKDKKRLEVEIIQPQYENLFKKYKIQYIKEYRMGKKRIDFMFIKNGKKYGLEVKRSDKKFFSGKESINHYKKLSRLKQYALEKVILSDPEGVFNGFISLKEFELFISK